MFKKINNEKSKKPCELSLLNKIIISLWVTLIFIIIYIVGNTFNFSIYTLTKLFFIGILLLMYIDLPYLNIDL